MKHIFLIGLVLFAVLLDGCGGGKSIVGKYKNVNSEYGDYVEFTSDGQAVFYNKGLKPQRGTYTADAIKSPMSLDMKMSEKEKFAAIYKFEGDDLVIRMSTDDKLADKRLSDWDTMPEGYKTKRYARVGGSIPAEYQTGTSSP